MANTKEMTRDERKATKRVERKKLKKTFRQFTSKQMDEYREKPVGGVKGFLLGTDEEKE